MGRTASQAHPESKAWAPFVFIYIFTLTEIENTKHSNCNKSKHCGTEQLEIDDSHSIYYWHYLGFSQKGVHLML